MKGCDLMYKNLYFNHPLNEFLEFVRSRERYFGKDYCSSLSFLLLYLNYDSKHNFLRQYLIDNTKENYIDLNLSAMKLNSEHYEEIPKDVTINDITISVSSHFHDLLNKTFKEKDLSKSSLSSFIYSIFFENDNPIFIEFFNIFIPNGYNDLKASFLEYISSHEESISDKKIPDELSPYLYFREDKYEFNNCEYRDYLYEIAWSSFFKSCKNKVAIFQNNSFDTESFINGFGYELSHEIAPSKFKGYKIANLDLNTIADLEPEPFSKILKDIHKFVIENKIILYLKDFYLAAIDYEKDNMAYFYELIDYFTDPKVLIIANGTQDSFSMILNNMEIAKYFMFYSLNEPESAEIQDAIKSHIKILSYFHGVIIEKLLYNRALTYVNVFLSSSVFQSLYSTLDVSMNCARMDNRYIVEEKDLKGTFNIFFKEYDKWTPESKELSAVHEAGHYVVSRFCKNIRKFQNVQYINIVPIGDMGGFNLLENNSHNIKTTDYKFYLEYIASLLGGRAAEELFLKSVSSGASSDLEMATEVANSMILNHVSKKSSKKIASNENMQSEKSINYVSRESTKIIRQAYKLAKHVLVKKQDYLLGLADYLLEHKVIDVAELKEHEANEDGHVVWKD